MGRHKIDDNKKKVKVSVAIDPELPQYFKDKSINLSSSLNVKVSKRDPAGVPLYFVLKTEAEVIAGKTVTEIISIGDYESNKY